MRLALLCVWLVGCASTPSSSTSPPAPPRGFDVEPVSGLGFFADEELQSQALLVRALQARDAGVLDPNFTRRAWALSAEGRHPLTGASCGRPLARWEARTRWGAQLGVTGVISASAWCTNDGGCELNVYARPLGDDGEGQRWRLEAPLARDGVALTALEAALPNLAPPPPASGGGGLGLLGSAGANAPLRERDELDVRVSRADGRARREKEEGPGFPSLVAAQALGCFAPGDSWVQLRVQVNAEGALTRCEAVSLEDPGAVSCLCSSLQRAGAAEHLWADRWSVSLSVRRSDLTTSDRALILSGHWNTHLVRTQVPGQKYPRFSPKVEDPSLLTWGPGDARLATGCFSGAFTAAGRLSSRWAVWFDGQGRPTKVAEQKGFPALPPDVVSCVARALKTSLSPCPARPGLWAMTDLHVTARDPNAPAKSLSDVLEAKQPQDDRSEVRSGP